MTNRILDIFSLYKEKEDFNVVRESIEDESVFQGTNLWILFFAILVASLGLNINSTAVVIGAMLISPLMGPIVGVGFGVATKDLPLIRKAMRNYVFAAAVGLVASTVYFLLTPVNEAHSEILARTQPTIYDVLIAFFAGFAGIIAIASKHKGNVIPGVAIATALIPPLCTAGYGLATWHLNYFIGAIYLYLINSVFIGAAAIITVSLLKFPPREYEDPKSGKRKRQIVWAIIVLTLIPSLYLSYDIFQQNEFTKTANQFIKIEARFTNDYLLEKQIDARQRKITLIFGGQEITEEQIRRLESRLPFYQLDNASLEIQKGFSFLKLNKEISPKTDEQATKLGILLKKSEEEKALMRIRLDSINNQKLLGRQIFDELKVQFPEITEAIVQPVVTFRDSVQTQADTYLVLATVEKAISEADRNKIEDWLKVRLNNKAVRLIIQGIVAPEDERKTGSKLKKK